MTENKRGQITIFIIIGIVIIILGVLIYMFLPNIKTTLGFEAQNPSAFMQNCLEDEIQEAIKTISSKGGSLSPLNYIEYQNEKIEYLCYTNEYYKTCVVQQPMLKNHIENEIKNGVRKTAENCADEMKKNYERQGYEVNLKGRNFDVELLPKRVVMKVNASLILKNDDAKKYDSIEVVVNNNLYELVSIANSILNWEANYGDAETTAYMNYYRDLKVEKKKQSDGSTIYILTDRNNGNKFQFASRSVAWPPGYGAGEVI